ncbi:hypothetical protein LEM8419_01454 [Neolewinella maritima]|uniref:Rhodanese domain-containing protein n=1 Tax=Neolewinella maritima TaxID=1383882 RepID=A0ABM9B0Z1_9BACT|nr:hypothetical protein [Neolewinella maritima]CAH1000303.1 hypothetical protein LEM8419_01454 [Neolewinella maritima]
MSRCSTLGIILYLCTVAAFPLSAATDHRDTPVPPPIDTAAEVRQTQIRIIHHPDRRPVRLIEIAGRYGQVQPIAYDHRIVPALAAASARPTLLVVDGDAPRSASAWYRALYTQESVIMLYLGGADHIGGVPASWTVIRAANSAPAVASVVQTVFGELTPVANSGNTRDIVQGNVTNDPVLPGTQQP